MSIVRLSARRGARRPWFGLSMAAAIAVSGVAIAPASSLAAPEVSPSLADLPLEASLTAVALRQVRSADAAEVMHGLYALDGLLALPGFRGEAVTSALESEGALGVLTAVKAKGRAGKELLARIRAEVERRLGQAGAPITPAALAAAGETPTLVSLQPGRTWLSVPGEVAAEAVVVLEGCDHVRVRRFDGAGRRLGAVEVYSAFAPARLGLDGAGERVLVAVDDVGACAPGAGRVGFVRAPAPPAVRTDAAAVNLPDDGVVRVRPTGDGVLQARFMAEPATLYDVRTIDLEGRTDTRLAVRSPEGAVVADDDGGGGLASQVSLHTLSGGPVAVEVTLARAGLDSSYRLAVQRRFRYETAGATRLSSATLEGEPASLPGAAWSGAVVPLTLDDGGGRFGFMAQAGTVYTVQTPFEVTFLGPGGAPALRLLREASLDAPTVAPVVAFLALATGPTTLQVAPTPAAPAGTPGWFQMVASIEPLPVPREAVLGSSAASPLRFSTDGGRSDGGVLSTLAPGGEGWLALEPARGVTYEIAVDAEDDAGLVVTAFTPDRDRKGELVRVAERSGRWAAIQVGGSAAGPFLLRVRRADGADPNARVRVEVHPSRAYDGFGVGDRVALQEHRALAGDRNWSEGMRGFVGRSATITGLAGRDAAGAWVVRVDLDRGEFVWRTRDLTLLQRTR